VTLWIAIHLLFRIRIVGAGNVPKTGPALIVSNHVSYADAILIGCTTRRFIRFLMWQPLYENKWLNPFCRLLLAIPLAQGSPKEALRALRSARTELEHGHLVAIFPEGEMTTTGQVKPFERGVEVILRGVEPLPVVPIHIDGLWGHPLSRKGGASWGAWLASFRHPVTLFVGAPMTGKVSADEMQRRVLELRAAAA
jgi:1-acyl-sn-glycerol-3-phosphate acyltransferase